MPLRIYTDENVSTAIAEGLRLLGIDARSARDTGHLGVPDEVHLTYATSERFTLFTHDDDFLAIAAEWRSMDKGHSGIVFAAQRRYRIGESIRRLEEYAKTYDSEDIWNSILYL
ncbi:MAG: DUF5615 family PIN-like protein [Candidatus Poribacteria bacterium]|nr:DUF5615 family PIN-like protein [Candidatus Poribacteria bacterium]